MDVDHALDKLQLPFSCGEERLSRRLARDFASTDCWANGLPGELMSCLSKERRQASLNACTIFAQRPTIQLFHPHISWACIEGTKILINLLGDDAEYFATLQELRRLTSQGERS